MLGSALFVLTFTVEGWLRPGYDPRAMFVSELAIGPRGWVQDLNFLVVGTLFLVFARGMAAEARVGTAARAGPTLLTAIGLALFGSAFFVTDTGTTPREEMSRRGRIHAVLGAVVFSLAPVSCFVFWRRFARDPQWRPLRWWTAAAGAATTASVVVLAMARPQPPSPPNALTPWSGLIQRVLLVTYLGWVFAVAWRLGTVPRTREVPAGRGRPGLPRGRGRTYPDRRC